MIIKNIENVEKFLAIADSCKGEVTLTSIHGHRFNLKSKLNQYPAVATLLGKYGDDLELWCTDKEDELKFMKMFRENPEILGHKIGAV